MPLTVIQPSTNISNDKLTLVPTYISALTNGGYVVTYNDFGGFAVGDDVRWQVFDASGRLTAGSTIPFGISDLDPVVTGLSGGGFAIAWDEPVVGPGEFGAVSAATFDAQGNLMTAFRIDSPADNLTDTNPTITSLGNDRFAVSWLRQQPDGFFEIYNAVYDSLGNVIAAPQNVSNAPDADDQVILATVLSNGNYSLTWRHSIFDTPTDAIFTAIYTPQGLQVTPPTQLTNTPLGADRVHIAVLANGNYMLEWVGFDPLTLHSQVFLAVYDPQGAIVTAPHGIGDNVNQANIARLAGDHVAVVWGDTQTNHTAILDSLGQLVSTPVDIISPGGSNLSFIDDIVALSNGAYAVILEGVTGGGVGSLISDIFTTVFDSNGHELVAPVNISSSPDVDDAGASALALANGRYVVTWNASTDILDDTYTAIFQFSNDQNVGDINVVGSADINIDLSAIINVGGDVIVRDNGNAVTIDLHNLASVGGNFVLSDNGALLTITLSSLTTVGGNLTIDSNTAATVINAGSLAGVSGNLDISGNTTATAINAGGLTTVGGNLTVDNDTAATVINAGSLTTVGGNLDLTGNTTVVTIDLGALIQAGGIVISKNGVVTLNLSALVKAGGDVSITNNHSLLTIDMPDLAEVNGNLTISGNTSATAVDASNLASVDGDVDISGNDSATVVNAANLVTVGGNVTINLAPDATVDASALGPGGGTVHVIGDDGHETTVILGSLAQMQGTLTIATSDGVTLTSAAGLATITLTGTAGDNILIGSAAAANIINAGAGNDTATGGGNADRITGGAGADLLDGQGGVDTAVYSGNRADYSVVRKTDGSLTITDNRPSAPDGSDTLSNFELFQFADGVLTLAELLPSVAITSNGGGDSAQAVDRREHHGVSAGHGDQSQCGGASGFHGRRRRRCGKIPHRSGDRRTVVHRRTRFRASDRFRRQQCLRRDREGFRRLRFRYTGARGRPSPTSTRRRSFRR